MPRRVKLTVLLLALSACADVESANRQTPDGPVDPQSGVDATVRSETCVDEEVEVCTASGVERWSGACKRSIAEVASGGIYAVCIVNPAGSMGVVGLRGDLVFDNADWRHSGYGGGNIKSTLLPEEEPACEAAAQAFREAGYKCPQPN